MTMRTIGFFPLLLVLGLGACQRTKAAPTPVAAGMPASAVKAQAASKLAKIVFIDKEKACDCTRKRVEETWTALQSALGTPPALPVERLHVDTQAVQAAAYTTAKPLMVPPGIYFVDGQGAVVELLQGEIQAKEIEALVKGR
jgi:hypothetical protein